MFPEFTFNGDTPTVEEPSITEQTELGEVPMMTFNGHIKVRIENGKVVMAKNIKEKVEMYTALLLRTELDKYKVYEDTDFGMTYFNFIGNNSLPIAFVGSEIERELTNQLSKLSVFSSITDFDITKNRTTLNISFTINLIDNTTVQIESEV